jgi:hypothetical protein
MKKAIFILLAVALVSCGKKPQEKYDIAKHCLDSLKDNGAKNSIKYYDLLDMMKYTDGQIEVENSKLFKKYDDVNKGLDEIINVARTFVITNDRPADVERARRGVSDLQAGPIGIIPNGTKNPNIVTLEVQLTFDTTPTAIDIASKVDLAVRSAVFNAKLISVKIVE